MDEKKNWKEIEGFNGRYFISDEGDVFSMVHKKLLKSTQPLLNHKDPSLRNASKYVYLPVKKTKPNRFGELRMISVPTSHEVGSLVLKHFGEKPPIGVTRVTHINKKNDDNRIENLIWKR